MDTQPLPITTPRSVAVLPEVIAALGESGRTTLGADMEARAKLGIERYGTPLMTHNGRKALADAYEELLDALMYVTQHQMETGDNLSMVFFDLKWIAVGIKAVLDKQGVGNER